MCSSASAPTISATASISKPRAASSTRLWMLGVTLFDTADLYGNYGCSEEVLGKVLGAAASPSCWRQIRHGDGRDRHRKGASRRYIMQAIDDSLRPLRTDWIDLYQVHQPDPTTPIEETLRALDDLVKAGKVRFIGCSNFSAAQLEEALSVAALNALTSFVCCQDEYSLARTRRGKGSHRGDAEARPRPAAVFPARQWFPHRQVQARCAVSRRHPASHHQAPRSTALSTSAIGASSMRSRQFAANRGHTMLELAMSWLASRSPVSSIIAGATRPEQVEQNVAAVGWTLIGRGPRRDRSHHCLSVAVKNAAADSPARNLSLVGNSSLRGA